MDIQDEVDNLETQQKETEDLKWRIFKLEVQLEQDTAHYRQRAETAEARVAELERTNKYLTQHLNDDADTYQEIDDENERLKERIAELEGVISDLRRRLDDFEVDNTVVVDTDFGISDSD